MAMTPTTITLDGTPITFDPSIAQGCGNAIAAGDPRRARAANAELERGTSGRCATCWAPLEPRRTGWAGSAIGRPPTFCSSRCRVWTWRRNGDPDAPLDALKG